MRRGQAGILQGNARQSGTFTQQWAIDLVLLVRVGMNNHRVIVGIRRDDVIDHGILLLGGLGIFLSQVPVESQVVAESCRQFPAIKFPLPAQVAPIQALLDPALLFAVLVIVGSANAVNLTDGLDGLAIMPVMIAAGSLGIIAYAVGRTDFTEYLGINYVPGTGEILIFTAGLIGGGLGFLWYNAPPAAVFMGDTGSLALGGALGAIAVATKHEIVLAIIGGLFVVEALSVIIQVAYYKSTGKRVFLMAPIHHHFEKKGWAEPQIVIRFWIVSLILALIGLATLKVR